MKITKEDMQHAVDAELLNEFVNGDKDIKKESIQSLKQQIRDAAQKMAKIASDEGKEMCIGIQVIRFTNIDGTIEQIIGDIDVELTERL